MSTNKNEQCAPTKTFDEGSCIPLYLLIEMGKALNKQENNDDIKFYNNLETINPSKYKKLMVKQIGQKLDKVCSGDQQCWLKQSFVDLMLAKHREELTKQTLRPEGPQGKFTWLNTFNINDVMNQYVAKYPEFKFFGALPIDFEKLTYEIANVNLEKLYDDQKKTKIGAIFNLDEHDKPGSHWVGFYADLTKCNVYFFDSYGVEPEPRIRHFLRKVARFCKSKNPNYRIEHNKIRHQFKNTECGVYSLHFVISMLEGGSFDTLCNNVVNDDGINKFRQVYFS